MKLYKWQYNGVAPFDEIYQWCNITFGSKLYWISQWETFYFQHEKDYLFFLLRWQ